MIKQIKKVLTKLEHNDDYADIIKPMLTISNNIDL